VLIGIHLSLQELRPFLFYGGEGASMGPAETGRTVGLPQEPTGVGGSAAAPKVSVEAGGSAVAPQDARGESPSAREQGVGLKRSHPNEVEQGSRGSPPKSFRHPTAPM